MVSGAPQQMQAQAFELLLTSGLSLDTALRTLDAAGDRSYLGESGTVEALPAGSFEHELDPEVLKAISDAFGDADRSPRRSTPPS